MQPIVKKALKRYLNRSKKGLVLVGHGADDRKRDRFIGHLHMDIGDLEKKITVLEELGFEFISMEKLLHLAENRFRHHKPWVHLTFDDGYENNLTHIYPLLSGKGIPFSVFVCTHHIETGERLPAFQLMTAILHTKKDISLQAANVFLPGSAGTGERINLLNKLIPGFLKMNKSEVMSFMGEIKSLLDPEEWEHYNRQFPSDQPLDKGQLRQLAADGQVYIGSHTLRHILLNSRVADEDVREEVETPRQWLNDELGYATLAFAYPNGKAGDFTALSEQMIKQAGYRVAFTAVKQAVSQTTDPFQIPRVSFPAKINGRYFFRILFIPKFVISMAKSIFRSSGGFFTYNDRESRQT